MTTLHPSIQSSLHPPPPIHSDTWLHTIHVGAGHQVGRSLCPAVWLGSKRRNHLFLKSFLYVDNMSILPHLVPLRTHNNSYLNNNHSYISLNWTYSSIPSFNKYLLGIYFVPSSLLGTGDTAWTIEKMILSSLSLHYHGIPIMQHFLIVTVCNIKQCPRFINSRKILCSLFNISEAWMCFVMPVGQRVVLS